MTTAGHCICFGENFIRLNCFSCPKVCRILHGICTYNLGAMLLLETSPKSRSPPPIRPRIHPRYLNTANATSNFSDNSILCPTHVFRQILFTDQNENFRRIFRPDIFSNKFSRPHIFSHIASYFYDQYALCAIMSGFGIYAWTI